MIEPSTLGKTISYNIAAFSLAHLRFLQQFLSEYPPAQLIAPPRMDALLLELSRLAVGISAPAQTSTPIENWRILVDSGLNSLEYSASAAL